MSLAETLVKMACLSCDGKVIVSLGNILSPCRGGTEGWKVYGIARSGIDQTEETKT